MFSDVNKMDDQDSRIKILVEKLPKTVQTYCEDPSQNVYHP